MSQQFLLDIFHPCFLLMNKYELYYFRQQFFFSFCFIIIIIFFCNIHVVLDLFHFSYTVFIMLEVIFVQCWLLFLYLLFYPRIKVGFVIYSYFILLLRKVILYTQGQCYNSSKVLFYCKPGKGSYIQKCSEQFIPKTRVQDKQIYFFEYSNFYLHAPVY